MISRIRDEIGAIIRLRLKVGRIWKGFARCGEISKQVCTLYFTKRILS